MAISLLCYVLHAKPQKDPVQWSSKKINQQKHEQINFKNQFSRYYFNNF